MAKDTYFLKYLFNFAGEFRKGHAAAFIINAEKPGLGCGVEKNVGSEKNGAKRVPI